MKNMKWLIVMAALLLMLSGCNVVQVNPERDAETVVAKIQDEVVTKGEFFEQYDYFKYYYGITEAIEADPQYAASIEQFKNDVMQMLVEQKVIMIKAKELNGYDFTDEQKADIEANINELKSSYKEVYKIKLKGEEANKDKTDEELNRMVTEGVDAYMKEAGVDLEEQRKSLEDQYAQNNVYDKVTDLTPPTDQEVMDVYNAKLKEQEEGFENGKLSYEQMVSQDESPLVVPGEARKAQHILIKLDQDKIDSINALRQGGDNEAADVARKEALEGIQEAADAAYKRVADGEDFETVMAELGEDPGMESKDYYVVLEDTKMFVPEFAAGLFALENEGDITEPVATDFGYHIIKYVEQIPAGAVSLETVKTSIYDELLKEKKDTAFREKLDTWKEELGVEVFMDRVE